MQMFYVLGGDDTPMVTISGFRETVNVAKKPRVEKNVVKVVMIVDEAACARVR